MAELWYEYVSDPKPPRIVTFDQRIPKGACVVSGEPGIFPASDN